MVARSHNALQSEAGNIDARPLTVTSTKTSCDARPDHTCGSNASIPPCPRHVRFAPNSDHKADMPAGRFGANWQHFAPQQTDPRFLRGWIRREATIVYPGTGGGHGVGTATHKAPAARREGFKTIKGVKEEKAREFSGDSCSPGPHL